MFHLKNYPALVSSILIFFLSSCGSNEIGESKDVNPATIYQDYKIVYKEGANDDQVEIWGQFRFAGDDGTTLILTNPSSITFDGLKIKVDSNEFAGAFYSLNIPVKNFEGKHRFVFTDINRNTFENEFSFDGLKLQATGNACKTEPLNIQFETTRLEGDDYIELASTDTDSSFSINHTAADHGDIISIPVNELQRQKGNTLSLVASVIRKIPLKQSTKEGGQIVLYYSLKPVTIKLF